MVTATEDVARELVLLVRALKSLHGAVVAESGVRVELAAAGVLATLAERGRMRLSPLAEALHVDLSSVSRQVAGLEREGWVERERDPADSRAVLLHLTEAGRDVLDRVRAARLARLDAALPGWSAADLEQFAAQLARFRTDLTGDLTDGLTSPATAPPAAPAVPAAPDQPAHVDRVPALSGAGEQS